MKHVKIPKEQFHSLASILRNVGGLTETDQDAEYRAYEGFIEKLEEQEVEEFFEKGWVTVGDWRLTADLSIVTKDTENQRQLSCTDGGAYNLPYFDRLIQKYLYLKMHPEKIINIGHRHLTVQTVDKLPGAPSTREDDITTITYNIEDILDLQAYLVIRPEENKVKIRGTTKSDHRIIYLTMMSDYKISRRGNYTIIERRMASFSQLVNFGGGWARFRELFCVKFPSYMLNKLNAILGEAGMPRMTDEQEKTVAALLRPLGTTSASVLATGDLRAVFKKKCMRDFLSMPGYIFVLFEMMWVATAQSYPPTIEVIKYYREHPDKAGEFMSALTRR